MRRLRRHKYAKLIIAGLYGLAMLLMPLAHRPVRQATPDLAAYALPDGTIPLLCSPQPGKPGAPSGRSVAVCAACLLTAAPGLIIAGLVLAPPVATPPMRLGAAIAPSVVVERPVTAARPRAPPAALA
jgi:hypothetical protein